MKDKTEIKDCNSCLHRQLAGFCHRPGIITSKYTDYEKGVEVEVWPSCGSQRKNGTQCGRDAKYFESGGSAFFSRLFG